MLLSGLSSSQKAGRLCSEFSVVNITSRYMYAFWRIPRPPSLSILIYICRKYRKMSKEDATHICLYFPDILPELAVWSLSCGGVRMFWQADVHASHIGPLEER